MGAVSSDLPMRADRAMRSVAMAAVCLIISGAAWAAAPANTSQWDDKAVGRAIAKGTRYLWTGWSEGHWPEPKASAGRSEYGGKTALCLYALLAAGADQQDPRVRKTLDWLAKAKLRGTYAVAFRANVWSMLKDKAKYARYFRRDVDRLVRGVDDKGRYGYWLLTPVQKSDIRNRKTYYDNSNSQIGVLGVWAGARSGITVDKRYWRRVQEHWVKEQNADGGWAYRRGAGSYGSMTAAGVATLLICFDNQRLGDSAHCRENESDKHIAAGLDWLGKNFPHTKNPPNMSSQWFYYYLYSAERVALAGGYRYFGRKDWYKLGAANLIKAQWRDGSWGAQSNTAFALLFLARGQHPVLFSKLRRPGKWNTRSRDMANLTRWISREFESPVNWQVVGLDNPVADWRDAPILYISGADKPTFTSANIAAMRKYVDQGGVILSEAACSEAAFTAGMRGVYARLFPGYKLRALPADHPLYSVHFKLAKPPKLLAVSNGVRLLAIHSAKDLSLPWQLNKPKTHAAAYQLGANVYFYVTDKGTLRSRGVSSWPEPKEFEPAATVRVAIIEHRANYMPEPLAWRRFAALMGIRHRLKVKISGPTKPHQLDPADWPAAAITGTEKLVFTEAQREALRKYVQAGGMLIIDAAGGSEVFANSAEAELAKILPGAKLARIGPAHSLYIHAGPAIKEVTYRRAIRQAPGATNRPRLQAIAREGRLAVIFSRDDLTAGLAGCASWNLRGYSSESSVQLMRNALLYASGTKLPTKPAPSK